MREGELVDVEIVAIHPYGIDVVADGRCGFIQPVELAWDHRVKTSDVGNEGDVLKVLVTAVKGARFSASIRLAHPDDDPWRLTRDLTVGARCGGVVEKTMTWGLVVELSGGLRGVVRGAQACLDVGDEVEVVVVLVDHSGRKLELEVVRRG